MFKVLVGLGWTLLMCEEYFYRLWAQLFRFGWRCYTISINVSTWFIARLGRLYFVWRFVTAFCRNSKKYWWCRCLRQHVRICNLIFSNGLQSYLTVLKLHDKRIGHLYEIKTFVRIILSLTSLPCTNYLTSNFNSLIFFVDYHWIFHLDWLFEIRTDPEFVQNPIWE